MGVSSAACAETVTRCILVYNPLLNFYSHVQPVGQSRLYSSSSFIPCTSEVQSSCVGKENVRCSVLFSDLPPRLVETLVHVCLTHTNASDTLCSGDHVLLNIENLFPSTQKMKQKGGQKSGEWLCQRINLKRLS